MEIKIGVDELSDAIMKEMKNYADTTGEKVKQISKEVTDSTVKELRLTSPSRTGTYAKSWKSKKMHESATKASYTVHSKDRYQLTHLLEKGHAKRNGGRVSEIQHIAPAEKKAIEEFGRKLREGL